MAITRTAPDSVQGEGQQLTIPAYLCAGADRVLLVSADIMSDTNESVSSVFYDGIALTRVQGCKLGARNTYIPGEGWVVTRPGLTTELWVLINPSDTPGDVVVTLTGSAKAIASALCIQGVAQVNPNYYSNNGIGDNVASIPLQVDLRDGFLIYGGGAVLADTYCDLKPGQEELWNILYASGEFRVQGIWLLSTVTVDMLIDNTLRQAAPWAVSLLGFAPVA